jgi:cytochrome P450
VVLPRGGGRDGQYPVMVRKGEDVAYCAYVMHRRKDIYGDDAEVFRPERWENGQLREVESSYGYIPFHGGPRICPGRKSVLTLSLCCRTDMRNRRLCAYRDVIYDCAACANV